MANNLASLPKAESVEKKIPGETIRLISNQELLLLDSFSMVWYGYWWNSGQTRLFRTT